MIATLLVFAALTAPPSAVVVEQKGDTLHVTKVPPTWREGMPVVVLWQPIRGLRSWRKGASRRWCRAKPSCGSTATAW